MNELLTWTLATAAGALLGVFFFGGLWWTVRKGLSAKAPALWFLGSLILRTGVAVAGFYFVSAGELGRMLACLLGFIIARLVIVRLQQAQPETPKINETCD